MNYAATIAAVEAPGVCWICKRDLPPDHPRREKGARICGSKVCVETRKRIYHLVERAEERVRCFICGTDAIEGRRVCQQHAYRRDPCEKCGGKVERIDRGNPRRSCMGCHPPRTARKSP